MAHTKPNNSKTVVSKEREVVLKTPITATRLKTISKKIETAQTLNHAELIQYNILAELQLKGFEIRDKYSDAWKAFHDKCEKEGWNPWRSSFPRFINLDLPLPKAAVVA